MIELALWLAVPYITDDQTFAKVRTTSKYILECCNEQNKILAPSLVLERTRAEIQRSDRRSKKLIFDSMCRSVYFWKDKKILTECIKFAIEKSGFVNENHLNTTKYDCYKTITNGKYELYYFASEGIKIYTYPFAFCSKRNSKFEKILNRQKISFKFVEGGKYTYWL